MNNQERDLAAQVGKNLMLFMGVKLGVMIVLRSALRRYAKKELAK